MRTGKRNLGESLVGLVLGAGACLALTGCDAPFLQAAFVREMIKLLGEHEIAVPRDGTFHHPLAAVYRRRILPQIDRLLRADRKRLGSLFDECATRHVPVDQLRAADPALATLRNVNHPDEYSDALRTAGLSD